MGLQALVVSALAAAALSASAQAPSSLEGTVALGRGGRLCQVRVVQTGTDVILQAGTIRASLPLKDARQLQLEPLTLPGGAAIAVARVQGNDAAATALLVQPANTVEIRWVGATGWQGDPGEREADALEIARVDGRVEVTVGRVSEQVRVCGQSRPLLAARALDPNTLQLGTTQPLALGPAPQQEWTLRDRPASTPLGAPLLRLRPRSGWTPPAPGGGAPGPSEPPHALADGELNSSWRALTGAVATLDWPAERPIRALALVPRALPDRASPSQVALPLELWLLTSDGARRRVRVPQSPPAGQRYWLLPDGPLQTSCLSVVVGAVSPGARPGLPVTLAELEAYSDLDFEGGLSGLIRELNTEDGDDAADRLASAGSAVLAELQRAWSSLNPAGRRRALRIASDLAPRHAAALEIVVLARADPELADVALAALLRAGPNARTRLAASVSAATPAGDSAALALARHAPGETMATLLGPLLEPPGRNRPALREAITIAAGRGGAQAEQALRAFANAHPDAREARAALILALAQTRGRPELHALALAWFAVDAPRVQEFDARFRLVQAARVLPADASVDGFLRLLAGEPERWMLRAAALEALQLRDSPDAGALAHSALHDPSPRVRATAAAVLARQPDALGPLALHAARDRWPLVRVAAIDALSERTDAVDAIRNGLGDRSHAVRAASLRALTHLAAATAWPLVRARLQDPKEAPDVVAEAVRYSAALCVNAAAPALLQRLRAGGTLNASSTALEHALLAFGALRRLGGEPAREAESVARGAAVPDALRDATRRPAGPGCPPATTPP